MYHTLMNMKKRGGDLREHAEAMPIEVQRKIILWSLLQVPNGGDLKAKYAGRSQDEISFAGKHIMMRAYMASAFTLWTRYVP